MSAAAIRPTGTLMKKIQGQPQCSEIQPPSKGPRTGATIVTMDQSASAETRRSGGYTARSIA